MLNDWHELGNQQFRKWVQYEIDWKVPGLANPLELEYFLLFGSIYGGPIALIADPRKLTNIPEPLHSKILIFTSAGKKLSEINWQEGQILSMSWNGVENLVVVNTSGFVRLYDLYGTSVYSFSLLTEEKRNDPSISLTEVHFWLDGLAAMTSRSDVRVAEGLSSIRGADSNVRLYTLMPPQQSERTFTAMSIIPPHISHSGFLDVYLATSDCSIIRIHENGKETACEDYHLQNRLKSTILKICISIKDKRWGFYLSNGYTLMFSSDFSQCILEFDTSSSSKPLAMEWCGETSLVLLWKNTGIFLIGPHGDWLNFRNYNRDVHIVRDIDCCRIFSSNGCELIQSIPSSTLAALNIGSTDPPALLIDAMEGFENGDPKADEIIRISVQENHLENAVEECITAASAEFDIAQQVRLLKAASYGKAFCPQFNSNVFVETSKMLRVLNEIRKPAIGLPLTTLQYLALTAETLVSRLATRNHHFLALQICEWLGLKPHRVLTHWACEKIRRLSLLPNYSDDLINNTITNQLKSYGRISYLGIAEAAYNIGRSRLATILLDNEQQPHDQIHLLLKMNQEELALKRSISSEVTDYIFYTISTLEMRANLFNPNQRTLSTSVNSNVNSSLDAFYRIIYQYPEAVNLLKLYYKYNQPINYTESSTGFEKLIQFLNYNKNTLEIGNNLIYKYFLYQNDHKRFKKNKLIQSNTNSVLNKDICDLDARVHNIDSLGQSKKILEEAIAVYGQQPKDKECALLKSYTEEKLSLLEFQIGLISYLPPEEKNIFIDLSLNETLKLLYKLSLQDKSIIWTEGQISLLIKKFKINEKIIYYLKVSLYSEFLRWDLLSKLANEKKSPISYRFFAQSCIDNNGPISEIEKYIEKITQLEDKYELYLDIKNYARAFDLAVKLKDHYRIEEAARFSNDATIIRQAQDILSKL